MALRLAALLAVASVAACSDDGRGDGPARTGSTTSAAGAPERDEASAPAPQEGTPVRIRFGEAQVDGTVLDTPTGRDLLEQLPLELTMNDHGGVEKTGALRQALSTEGAPSGADPDVGAIGYYAPYGDLVLYYGDQSRHDGIVVVGRMAKGFERLADLPGSMTVTVEAVDPP
ncbi:hypothetical protein ASD11_01140 [Aeromicrobium sp. Root495]|nr:hypothetical protein ASD11_01140 [Aeromicrobium sp. Root495]